MVKTELNSHQRRGTASQLPNKAAGLGVGDHGLTATISTFSTMSEILCWQFSLTLFQQGWSIFGIAPGNEAPGAGRAADKLSELPSLVTDRI